MCRRNALADHPDCIGIAIPGGSFRIADERGRAITAPGQMGELFYTGPNVMMGYATSREDLAGGAEVTELATGDIATFTDDGLIRLAGRKRRFSKIAGLRIGHDAIEWALRGKGITAAVTGNDEAITLHLEGTNAGDAQAIAAAAAGIPARTILTRCTRRCRGLPQARSIISRLQRWSLLPLKRLRKACFSNTMRPSTPGR